MKKKFNISRKWMRKGIKSKPKFMETKLTSMIKKTMGT